VKKEQIVHADLRDVSLGAVFVLFIKLSLIKL
jgi:hypothetical protein